MSKPGTIQICIAIFILIIGYFTYSYLNNDKTENVNYKLDKKTSKNNSNIDGGINNQTNKIVDLSYKSLDDNGNIYEIESTSGFLDKNNSNILLLKQVNAKISIYNYGIVYIYSDNAKYNQLNLDTHFFENVNLIYYDHDIKSDDLFLKYSEKEVKIANNVDYKHKNSKLLADEVKLDLITKISKIYMTDEKKKIKAIIKN